MSEAVTREHKVALQREMLADVAPELVGEIDRLTAVLEAVREAVALAEKDIDITRPHMYATKYMQGIVQGGDSALSRIHVVLRKEGMAVGVDSNNV